MAPLILLFLLQAAPTTPARPSPPQRMSILADPCAAATDGAGKDVIVCGRPDAITPRLPLRDDRGPPDHPAPANPEATGTGALAMESAPCAVRMGGCPGMFGAPVVAAAIEQVGFGLKGLKDARQRRRDGARRVTIDLDAPPPPIPADAIRP